MNRKASNKRREQMKTNRNIHVNEVDITVITHQKSDFISLTDMTSHLKEGSGVIGKWISNKNTIEYLGIWERINNPQFNYPEFGAIIQDAGTNRFILSAGQWVERTLSNGLLVKAGRYGGTYAHQDIAFHFAMWLSPEFQIYLIKEFQRLKETEGQMAHQRWDLHRTLAKVNYQIHTDAIREKLIPREVSLQQTQMIYAQEADLINVALFGYTAKEWQNTHPGKKGNLRDDATIEQLVVLSNLESIHSLLIRQGLAAKDRLLLLNQTAIDQMRSLLTNSAIRLLKKQ
jgi:hypothetical protein